MSDESLVSVTTFEPGEIVLVSTRDAQFGHIQVPGVVRYAHEGVDVTGAPSGYYAVALMVPNPQQSFLVDPMRGVHYWDLRPEEMKKTHCFVVVEHPRQVVSGQAMFMPDNDPKTIEQDVQSHRQTVL